MQRLKSIAAFAFGAFLVFGGINHFLNPEFYVPFVPSWISLELANWSSGILEVIFGVGLFFPKSRRWSAWGAFGLMLCFLPLHVWDVFRDDPAIGSATAAYIRLPVQFLFIAWTWWLAQPSERLFKRR
jgi:uncharacterized membrane protein